ARLPLVRQGRAPPAHARRPRRGARAFPRRPDRSTAVILRGPDELLSPLCEALRDAPAEEADIHLHRRRAAITRFSHSSIHQNALSDETHVRVRAIVGRAVGGVERNSLAVTDSRGSQAGPGGVARAAG